jgi:hypothetical protein
VTVADVIEQLSKFDPAAPVIVGISSREKEAYAVEEGPDGEPVIRGT